MAITRLTGSDSVKNHSSKFMRGDTQRMNWIPLLLVILSTFGMACQWKGGRNNLNEEKKPLTADSPEFDAINHVLKTHAGELMAIQGVVGIAIGLLEDEETPCLKIMVSKMTPELEKSLPKTLEGHPVVVDETGVIRPLDQD